MALNPTELAKAIKKLETEIAVNVDVIRDSTGTDHWLWDDLLSKLSFDANNYLYVNLGADSAGLLKKADLNFDANGYLNVNAQVVANPSNLDITLSALRDALKGANNKDFSTLEADVEAINSKLNDIGGHAYNQLIDADETAAQEITLDTKGLKLLEVYAVATTATNFYLDVSNDNTNWIEGYYSWSNVTEVKETYWNGFRYVKLRSDAAGASGDKVTLILSAK